MYARSVAFVKAWIVCKISSSSSSSSFGPFPFRGNGALRFQVALNVSCEDTGSVDFLTREFMFMLLYLAAGRLLASHADVLRGSSRVSFSTNGRKRVGKRVTNP